MTDEEPQAADGDVVRSDRFRGGPARAFLSSLDADERIFTADLAVDRAHVVMLAEQGIINTADATEILTALDAVEEAGFAALPNGEDIHAAIETAVINRIGDVGGKMHTARSRNDEVATCIRYQLREDLITLQTTVIDLRETLIDTASDHVDTLMPGYTHLQPAQPTTVGHWACSYESAIRRDTERFFDAYDRVNRSPLGAAALAGTPFDIDRERAADLLGFTTIIENAMDAAAARDFLLETAAAIATLATTLSGLAEDLIFYSNRGFVDLDPDYASTSSIMPQKKNPDSLELVRATAGDAAGSLASLITTLKGLPRAYNRDLQNATPHAWAAIDAIQPAAAVVRGAIATATWDEDALATAASEGFSTATGVADRLAMTDMPFRTAHQLVATAAETGADYAALDAAARDILGQPIDELVPRDEIDAALDPEQNVAMRDSTGGPAPAVLIEAIDRATAAIEADHTTLTEATRALNNAEDELETTVARYTDL